MRGAFALTIALLTAAALAGCSDGGDGDGTETTDNVVTKSSTSGTKNTVTGTRTTTTTTSLPPNVPVKVVLKVTDAGGNATNATLAGGALTFDASGSTSEDSDGIFAIAITVQDVNRTRNQVLYSSGAFSPATFVFDRAGPVNVTVSAQDGRGEISTLATKAYVNLQGSVTSRELYLAGAAVQDAATCKGPSEGAQPAADNLAWEAINIPVSTGVKWIKATITTGDGEIAICDPLAVAVSPSGPSVTTNPGTTFTTPAGATSYFVSVLVGTPNSAATVAYEIHYDPQPAA